MIPRGIRLNNPGNIRHSATTWEGQATKQIDSDFVNFVQMTYGVRAAAKIIKTYYDKYGLRTVRQIIARWAPANENNTPAYVSDVAKRMGVSPSAVIDVESPDIMFNLLKAIFHHENGSDFVSDIDIKAGVALCLNTH